MNRSKSGVVATGANSWMRPGLILQRAERQLALHPPQHEPTGDGDRLRGLGAGFERGEPIDQIGNVGVGLESIRQVVGHGSPTVRGARAAPDAAEVKR